MISRTRAFQLAAMATALAVGIAATVIGLAFPPHETVRVPSGTEIVPVLAPVTGELDADGLPLASRVVAHREVLLPGDDPSAIDPSLLTLITELDDSADPAFRIMTLDSDADGEDPPGVGDECSPREGEPAEDCPDGVHSAVFSVVALRDFTLAGMAHPPTEAEYLADPDTAPGPLWCDAPTDLGETDVPFGILATAPGNFHLEYWPVGHPEDRVEITGITTSEIDTAAFLSAIDTVEETEDLPLLRMCTVLEDLEPNTQYVANVYGVDINDRVAPPHHLAFQSAAERIRPGAQIVGLGDTIAYVAGLHPANERVEVRIILTGSDAVPSCSDVPVEETITPLVHLDRAARTNEIDQLNAPLNFTEKTSSSYALPEGSTALICVRWYPAGDAPPWRTTQPIFESSAVLQVPDRNLPVVELTSAQIFDETLTYGFVEANGNEGQFCGSSYFGPEQSDTVPNTTCDPRWARGLSRGDVHAGGEAGWDFGWNGDIVLNMKTFFGSYASRVEQRFLIPSVDDGCWGDCPLPESEDYLIWVETGRGSSASLAFTVHWVTGETNGLAGWNVTPTVDSAPDYVMADLPQIDPAMTWSYSEPFYPFTDGMYSTPAETGEASIPVRVDRAVDYTLRVLDPTTGAIQTSCTTGSPLVLTGTIEAERETELTLTDLCLGQSGPVELELTDAEGRSVVWGNSDRAHMWTGGGMLNTPKAPATIAYNARMQFPGLTGGIDDLTITVGDGSDRAQDRADWERCDPASVQARDRTENGTFATEVSTTVHVTVRIAAESAGNYATCRSTPGAFGIEYALIDEEVPIAALFSTEGVTLELPELYDFSIVLRGYKPTS